MRAWIAVLLMSSLACAEKAQPPLGVVDSVAEGRVALRFDASVRLAPGSVVAIYGPGAVEKHPLTKQVIVERPLEVAKAQVLSYDGTLHWARLAWLAGHATAAAVAPGMDVVPVPGAAPNAPPTAGDAQPVSAALGALAEVAVPVSDPDGDAFEVTWSLDGPPGRCGRLGARTTRTGAVAWIAPGALVEATLRGVARDALGQETAFSVPLRATPLPDDWRTRQLVPFQRFAGEPHAAVALARDPAGDWWTANRDNSITRIGAGWTVERDAAFPKDGAPGKPVAIAPRGDGLWVLDAGAKQAVFYGPDLIARRRIEGLDSPTGLAVDADGVVAVADQGLGGVMLYEPDGRLRCRLGQPGKGKDDFEGLARVCATRAGGWCALDAKRRRVHRWDASLRRLPSWEVPGDDKNPPVDLAEHPRGLLVLQAVGRVLVVDAQGSAGEAMPSAAQARLADDTGAATTLAVDLDGSVYVAYAEGGLIARYAADGKPTGLRGGALAVGDAYAVDGRGRLFALDKDTQLVRLFDAEGFRVARFGGSAKHGGALTDATAMAVAPDGSALAVIDGKRRLIARFTVDKPDEKPLVFGGPGRNNGQFDEPVALAMDEAGRTYVLDAGLHRVTAFAPDGGYLFEVGHYAKGKQPDELVAPKLIAAAPAGDALFVYDDDAYEIRKFALDQQAKAAHHVANAGGKGDGPGQLRKPLGIACDRIGLLSIVDAGRGDLQVLDFRGSNAVPAFAKGCGSLGVKAPRACGASPDGQVYLGDDTRIIGVRW